MTVNVEILAPQDAVKSIKKALGPLSGTRFASEPSEWAAERLLVTWVTDLDSVRCRHELDAMWDLVVQNSGKVPVVFMSAETATLHSDAAFQALAHWASKTARELFVAPGADAVRRLVLAWQSNAEKKLIASAYVEGDKLVVWDCEPARYEVAVSEIPALAVMTPKALGTFSISASGSRMHWPDADVDINLDTIRERADPKVRRSHQAMQRRDAARYAGAIRQFREERGLKQTDITGLSERQMRRIEEGNSIPHSETLKKLSAAHGMHVEDYLAELTLRSGAKRTHGAGQRAGRG